MNTIVVRFKVHGIEMWQVYSKDGFICQRWSKEAADYEAHKWRLRAGNA